MTLVTSFLMATAPFLIDMLQTPENSILTPLPVTPPVPLTRFYRWCIIWLPLAGVCYIANCTGVVSRLIFPTRTSLKVFRRPPKVQVKLLFRVQTRAVLLCNAVGVVPSVISVCLMGRGNLVKVIR